MFRLFRLLFPVFTCVLVSCDDDSEGDAVNTTPEITIVSPKENQRLTGMITIQATIADLSSEVSSKVFVDNKLVSESKGDRIEVDVDSKTLTDGKHSIKIVATNIGDKTSEKAIEVEVRNTLFSLRVPSNFAPQHAEIYFTLSRNDGTLIAVKKIENSANISVPTPADFNPDSSFVYAEYNYSNWTETYDVEYGFLIKRRTYWAGIYAGEFSFPELLSSNPTQTGIHNFEITNVPVPDRNPSLGGSNFSSYSYSYYPDAGIISGKLQLDDITSSLYFSIDESENEDAAFKYIPSIQAGGFTEFSYNDLEPMQKSSITTKDNVGYGSSGAYINDSFLVGKRVGFANGKITFYYPSSAFSLFTFYFSHYHDNNSGYVYRVTGMTPPASFQYLDASIDKINYANRRLEISAAGDFDIFSLTGGQSATEGNLYSSDRYNVNFPQGSRVQITLPGTPAELAHLEFSSPAEFKFEDAEFSDYLDFSGHVDFQYKIAFPSDYAVRNSSDLLSFSTAITPTSEGGRLREQVELPKELSRFLEQRSHLGVKTEYIAP